MNPTTSTHLSSIANSSSQKMTQYLLGGLVWCVGWLAIFLLKDYFDLSNLGMLLVLTSVLAAVCLPLRISLLSGAIFILAFDWFFIPPKGTFTVDFHQHALMLVVMLVVNIIIVSLVSVQRAQSDRAARHASEADMLRKWSDTLHQSLAPHEHIEELQELLMQLTNKPVALLVLKNDLPAQDDPQSILLLGEAGIEQRHALWHCTRYCQSLGRGTGRYEMFSDVYLPLRARGHAMGAALVCDFAVHEFSTRVHLQAICDQLGNALDRYRMHQQEILARENAQSQLVRNSLLAAISHDYRTPLATIMGAASSLNEQTEKLDAEKQHQLASRIYDEAERLNIMTSNILQLARLDADDRITCDWQSAEEIFGDLMRRWRGRNLAHRLQLHLDANLPLLWCDAILVGQLLENLVDNAFKYSPVDSIVNVSASVNEKDFLLSVSDAGPGIDPRWRAKIFEPFQRGPFQRGQIQHGSMTQDGKPTPGAGIGLALCRAIALAHGGELIVECPDEGGSRFIFRLPLRALPKDLELSQASREHQ